jgi:hypothetical protein
MSDFVEALFRTDPPPTPPLDAAGRKRAAKAYRAMAESLRELEAERRLIAEAAFALVGEPPSQLVH